MVYDHIRKDFSPSQAIPHQFLLKLIILTRNSASALTAADRRKSRNRDDTETKSVGTKTRPAMFRSAPRYVPGKTKLTESNGCATFLDADLQHVDERARQDQIAENCAVGCPVEFVAHAASQAEIDTDRFAVGESQVRHELVDGFGFEPLFGV